MCRKVTVIWSKSKQKKTQILTSVYYFRINTNVTNSEVLLLYAISQKIPCDSKNNETQPISVTVIISLHIINDY